jgi:hypothetical protein
VVDVPSPKAGEWLVVVEGVEVPDSQSIAGTSAEPRQDFSLVFDIPVTAAADAEDDMGRRLGTVLPAKRYSVSIL